MLFRPFRLTRAIISIAGERGTCASLIESKFLRLGPRDTCPSEVPHRRNASLLLDEVRAFNMLDEQVIPERFDSRK